jgi:uncharacterized membrane protein YhhN
MLAKKTYFLLIIPAILAYFAKSGYGFGFKAAVTISCIFILAFLFRKRINTTSGLWYIFAAFVFSIAGDWFLSNKGDSFMVFSAGIGLYFVAHAGYLLFALVNGRIHKIFTLVLLVGYLLFFFVSLFPSIENNLLLVATFLYLLISCFSLGAAAGIKLLPIVKWSYFSGVALILFSDTIIALYEFTAYRGLNFLILPTYYAAHIVITFGLINMADNEADGSDEKISTTNRGSIF